MAATAVDIKEALRSLSLKDLRVQCRARGLSPAGKPSDSSGQERAAAGLCPENCVLLPLAGGMEALTQRVTDSMAQTGNLTIYAEQAQEQGEGARSRHRIELQGVLAGYFASIALSPSLPARSPSAPPLQVVWTAMASAQTTTQGLVATKT